MGAGQYSSRVQVLDYTPTANTSNGQSVPNWTASGTYWWCSISETNGRRTENYGGVERTGADAEIRVRNNVAVDPRCHLLDGGGSRWIVDTVYQGDDETVIQAYRFDAEIPLPVEE